MSVAKVQQTDGQAFGTSLGLVLGAAPTNGNLLVAVINAKQYPDAGTVSPPSGSWVQIGTTQTGSDTANASAWRYQAGAGESATQTFTCSGSNRQLVGCLFEFSGHNTTTPINKSAWNEVVDTYSTHTTSSVTPDVLSCFALAVQGQEDQNNATITSVTAGWTIQTTEAPGVDQVTSATKDALTADTVTAIACDFNFTGHNSSLMIIMLIAPASTPPSAAFSGTATASITEADIVAGGKVLTITLTNETFIA